QTGSSVIQGWYLTMFVPVEALLCVAGASAWFGKRWNWMASGLAVLFFALLLYSLLFVAMPYYAGMTAHTSSWHLETYHPAFTDFSLMTERLMRFLPTRSPILPAALLSIVAAFGVAAILRIGRLSSVNR